MSWSGMSPTSATHTTTPPRYRPWWHAATIPGKIVCDLCPRACALGEGDRGFCFVRQNVGGQVVSTTYGRSTGFVADPVEKKPLNHFFPGTSVLSFGTAGCNLGCKFCQNWSISKSRDIDRVAEAAAPEQIAEAAARLGCRSVAFTYNDPIIWAEYAIDTATACRERGIKAVAVTSGYISPAARAEFFAPMDAANVDLKGFNERFYWRLTSGHLGPVLDTLRWLVHESKVWVEITNLIIPRANDDLEELEALCHFVRDELNPDVPLHFTAFHPDFRLNDRGPTPAETLITAHDIARRVGLKYVYTGNVSDWRRQSTYCGACGELVIERDGYRLGRYAIVNGRCGPCGEVIPGHFEEKPGEWGPRRLPVSIGRIAPQADSRRGEPRAPDTAPQDPRLETTEEDRKSHEPRAARQAAPDTPLAEHSAAEPRAAQRPPAAKCTEVRGVPRPVLTEPQRRAIAQAAAAEVAAAVQGQRSRGAGILSEELGALPVEGAFVSLKRAGRLRSCCGFLASDAPLWRALSVAAQRAATEDPRFPPIDRDELLELAMEVWLLWGMEPVAGGGEERVRAVRIGEHGLHVSRGANRGLLLPSVAVDHHLDPRGFLRQICIKAGLPPDAWEDESTHLSLFRGEAIRCQLAEALASPGATVPSDGEDAPQREDGGARGTALPSCDPPRPLWLRPPAVAGQFYPGTAEEVATAIDHLLPPDASPQRLAGAMVPHAGWVYSGRLAAAVLARIAFPARVIVFCPKHRPRGADWAVMPCDGWELPGGTVPSDPDLATRLAAAVGGMKLDAAAHAAEHAIEVQLPLIHRLAPEAKVVGVALHGGEREEIAAAASQLAALVASLPEPPLLIASTDMNHFADDAKTRRKDRLALEAVQALDPAALLATVRREQISMCGVIPTVLVMETLRRLGHLGQCELVGYATSAEVSGDRQRVVGYAGALFN